MREKSAWDGWRGDGKGFGGLEEKGSGFGIGWCGVEEEGAGLESREWR